MNFRLTDPRGSVDLCVYHILHAIIQGLGAVENGSELALLVAPSEAACEHCTEAAAGDAVETAKSLPVN